MTGHVHIDDGIIVDIFAGGGGSSLGIRWATGRSPDVAVDHNPEALAVHAANHHSTRHYCEDVWSVDPVQACAGRPVALAWFSPECTHFSRARGGRALDDSSRGLAWVVIRWAQTVRPRVIIVENVSEFRGWGPLDGDGRPDPEWKGSTFQRWLDHLTTIGYEVDMREVRACDYGAPTIRKRLFVVARCDGEPIVWPEPTHGPGRPQPHRVAAECIDWSLPCPSIFERGRPLAEATLRRIARGVRRYVIEAAEPFIVPTGWGEHPGQAPRTPGLDKPIGTVVAGGVKHALAAVFLARYYGVHENDVAPLQLLKKPMPTVTATSQHRGEARAFLIRYNGREGDPRLELPLGTVTAKHRFGLVTVHGHDYVIADIGMRMLAPRELYRAQGFPNTYKIDPIVNGNPLSKAAQVRMCGNSVCPPLAAAIVRAQFAERQVEEVAG